MLPSRVKKNLFLTFEIAAKWQNVGYTRRSYRLISLNQPISKGINLPVCILESVFYLLNLDKISETDKRIFKRKALLNRMF